MKTISTPMLLLIFLKDLHWRKLLKVPSRRWKRSRARREINFLKVPLKSHHLAKQSDWLMHSTRLKWVLKTGHATTTRAVIKMIWWSRSVAFKNSYWNIDSRRTIVDPVHQSRCLSSPTLLNLSNSFRLSLKRRNHRVMHSRKKLKQ